MQRDPRLPPGMMVEDEEEQVGPRGEVARLGLAMGPAFADLRQSRRVGQEDGPVNILQLVGEGFAALGRADGGLGPAHGPSQEGVDQ